MLDHTPELSGLAENPGLPQHLLDGFTALADEDLCQELARRPDLTVRQARNLAARCDPWTLRELIAGGALAIGDVPRDDPWLAVAAAGRADVPAAWLQDLARDPEVSIRIELVEFGGHSEDLLHRLGADPHIGVVCAVAEHTALPAALARQLATRPDVRIRDALARNTATPPDVLTALLAGGGHPPVDRCSRCEEFPQRCGDHETAARDVRAAALQNPSTPATGLERFLDSPDVRVRAALAGRPDLPDDAHRRLAADPDSRVRRRAAANPAVGETLIRVLATDPDRSVRTALTANPALPMPLLRQLAPAVRLGAEPWPRITAASPGELRDLARSTTAQLRALVAAHPALPADLVAALADDADPAVVKRLAAHPALTPDRLRALAERHGPALHPSVAGHPNCPPDLLHAMAGTAAPGHETLLAVARHPAAAPETLRRCLDAPDERVRSAAAANPALPVAVMARLLGAAASRADGPGRAAERLNGRSASP
ncbi:variant leucine-rich repeat-containing protein [Kitasatospora sp. NPDC003701]